jgi:hypothetical protein
MNSDSTCTRWDDSEASASARASETRKGFAARQRVHRAHLVAHVLIHHQQPEAVLEPLQPVAAGEAFEVAVGVAEEHVEGELLGEVAELLAVGRADQMPTSRVAVRARRSSS